MQARRLQAQGLELASIARKLRIPVARARSILAPMKARRIRGMSVAMQGRMRRYLPLKAAFMAQHPRCQVRGCRCVARDLHHRQGRRGWRLCAVGWFMAVCRRHHDMMKEQPTWALEHGYVTAQYNR